MPLLIKLVVRLLGLLAILLVITLYKRVFHVSLTGIIRSVVAISKSGLLSTSKKVNATQSRKYSTKSREEKRSSLYYKINMFIQSIITDMGWQHSKVINTEYVIICILALVFVFDFLMRTFLKSSLARFLINMDIVIWIIAILMVLSRNRVIKRRAAVRDAMTLICQNIEHNLSDTIAKCINSIDVSIREPFYIYQNRLDNQGQSNEVAIEELKAVLGPESYRVLDRTVQYAIEGSLALKCSFQDYIELNAEINEIEIDNLKDIKSARLALFSAIGIGTATLIVFYFISTRLVSILSTGLGQAFVAGLFMLFGLVLIKMEIVNSERVGS